MRTTKKKTNGDVRIQHVDEEPELPFGLDGESSTAGAFSTAAAVTLQLAVVATLIAVLQTNIYLDTWTALASSIHLVYTTGIAVLATLVTAVTAGAIRKLWFRHTIVEAASTTLTAADNRQARVITGLGSFKDQVRSSHISLAFIVVGLVTAAIVAGLTPRTIVVVSPSMTAEILTDPGGFCINSLARRSTAGQWFYWALPDGTGIGLDQDLTQLRTYCSPRQAVDHLLTGIAYGLPDDASYSIGDVLVQRGAAGVPLGTQGLDRTFGTQRDSNFQWATRCLPTLQQNPVRCEPAGSVAFTDTNNTLSVTSGNCTVRSNSLRVPPSNASAAVLGACTDGRAAGQATVLIGAVDQFVGPTGSAVQTSDNGYAYKLKQTLNYTSDGGRSYAATCTVNIAGAVALRTLNYSRSDSIGQRPSSSSPQNVTTAPPQSGYGYIVSPAGGDDGSCTMSAGDGSGAEVPLEHILGPKILANGAGAAWPLLSENVRDDGWFDTLNFLATQAASYHTSEKGVGIGGGTFADSRNGLEDALGAVAAVAMGFQWAENSASAVALAPADNAYLRVRLGPSNPLGYLYLIPELAALGLLGWLVWGTWRRQRVVAKS